MVCEEFEGRGYATEWLNVLIDWVFKYTIVTCVAAETFPALHRSIRVMEKCGLMFVGNGSEQGTILYERVK